MMNQTTPQIDVAWACRMLGRAGQGDWILGHVSARGAGDRLYMKRSGVALNEVTPADILTINLRGERVGGNGVVHSEYPLHTEVYKQRPDIGAVIHTHPPYGVALGSTIAQLELLGHDAIMFYDGLATYRGTAELIALPEQGRSVADALGSRRAVLLGNHGVLVVGKNVHWAVVAALTLERAIRIQSLASTFGSLCPISSEMAQRLFPTKYNDSLVEQYWQFLLREMYREGLDRGMP